MEERTAGTTLERARTFVWSNARLLERQLFTFLFDGGSRGGVLAALRAYQNEDGGFGNGLEPDKRCPASLPVDVQVALEVLDEVGFDADLALQCCAFLQTITTDDGGVPFVLPVANDYPGQPWWRAEPDPPASVNPTAAIAGLLHKHGIQHPWLDRATEFCWREIESKPGDEPHAVLCALTFLQHAPDRARAERAFDHIGRDILRHKLVALDPGAEGYVKFPLDYAPSPDALGRRLFDDEAIAANLDALAARQQADGGWPISWGAISPMSELEWRGLLTIESLKKLRAYGRI